jgi:mono/diheme cytochrome c family protein
MAKIVLFAVLLGFAAANRTRFVPALDGPDPVAGKRALLRSIGMETGTGFLVVIAAGILTSLPPAIHEQPVWPFTLQPSLTTIREDLDFRREVELAVAILLTAAGLFAAGLCVRRLRWPGIIGSVLLTWIAAPHLDLLFVQAYPTSFYNSATGFAADAIADGAALYPTHCAGCHGPDGKGDGPAAKGLALPPADLTAGHLWAHSDGEMFWWLTHGIDGPEGGLAMPGFGGVLSEDQRWSLIDYVRAHNIGLVFAASGAWSPPIQAPGFAALCARGNTIGLDDLRGKIVRLVFLGTKDAVVPSPTARIDGVDVVTIMAPARSGVALSDDAGCTIQDSATVQAYAIVAGVSPDAMSGSRFLIDGNGWLRGMSRPDGNPDAPNRDDTASLRAEIGRIIANPISASAGGHAHHH